MTERPNVAAYMATELTTVSPETEINRAIAILLDKDLSGAPVVDARGRLVAVLSMRDCLQAALKDSYHQEWGGKVADFMSSDVETLDADLDIVTAAEKFVSSRYRRFPGMRHGRLVGQISRRDVLQALSDLW
jgi:CBS domain-containing protein